jgi:lysophospholipase L1-like esterase
VLALAWLVACGGDGDMASDENDGTEFPDDGGDVDAGRGPGDPATDGGTDAAPVAGDAVPYFVGRFDHAHFTGARFAWSGSSVSARFRGTRIAVELEDFGDNQFHVLVDGALQSEKLVPGPGKTSITLAAELAPGTHDVTLTKLTEPLLGEVEFHGFDVPDGELLPYFAPPGRSIELIGDSISAGYGNEGEVATCPFSAATENHYLAYGAIAARALGAELVTTAWSGKGVFSNRGSTTDTIPMPPLWERTLPARDDSRWDFALSAPDVVVINLGTNDLAPENTNQAPFAEAYRAFVENVRDTYPGATIFCALGPNLSDYWPEGQMTLSRARSAIQGAVTGLSDAGDERVFFVEFPLVMESEGWGCDYHPSLITHARMGEQLATAIAAELGW